MRTRLDSLLDTLAAHYLFNGAVLIAEDGAVVYEHSNGFYDRARQTPNGDTVRTNLASLGTSGCTTTSTTWCWRCWWRK